MKKILNLPVWLHVVLTIITSFLWLIVVAIAYFTKDKEVANATIEEKPVKKPIYEIEFYINSYDTYQDNIEEIVEYEKEHDNIDLYDGMTTTEIKECGYDVGEIEDQSTPKIQLKPQNTSTHNYISVGMYHEGFDKYLKIGNVPEKYYNDIIQYIDKNILIWGSYKGGTFKTVNNEGKLEKYEKPISVKLLIKVFEH